ncbi:MAG: hypothetical protein J5916_03585 [Oscillospiraceae bacterium]|nr:hypothetical protein [Oscillospiraceae bacterium]
MPGSSGVNAINRQKFLAELAKLLTFMYEEDRRYALEMYERMFDIAEGNEQWLLQNLMSPTRQAVIIARSYDAKERKLSVAAEWREDEEEDPGSETPPFVLAINKIFDDLFPDEEELEEAVDTLDASFDPDTAGKEEPKRPKMPKAAVLLGRTQEFESVTDSVIEGMDLIDSTEEADREEEWTDRTVLEVDESEREPDPRVQIVDRTEVYDSAEDEAASGGETKAEDAAPGSEKAMPAETEDAEQESEAKAEPGTDVETQPTETEPAEAGEQPGKRRSIEELLGLRKDKKRSENPEQSKAEPVKAAEEAAEAKPVPAEPAKKGETPELADPSVETPEAPEPPIVLPEDEPVIRKPESGKKEEEEAIPAKRVPNVPAMILFFIVAIPSVPVMLALLALITALFVSLSFGMIALGSILVISAFSGFAVLADILLLLGAAIIALALGLLFLWLAIWLVAGGMAGLIRSVRDLYQEWCFKEVPAA